MNINDNEAYNETIANAEYELIEAVRNYSKAFAQSSNENNGVPTIILVSENRCRFSLTV